MAKIPVKIDPNSHRKRQVTVDVYVDGQLYTQVTHEVEEWAVPHVVGAAAAQVEDPDYKGFADCIANGEMS